MSTENENIIDTSTEAGRQLLADENEAARTGVSDRTEELVEQSVDQQNHDDERDDERRQEPANVVVRMSPGDAAREAMAKKFRRGDAVPFNGDPNDPEMLYGDVARQALEPDPDVDPNDISGDKRPAPVIEDQQDEPPKKRKLLVRGHEVYLTEDEILARAAQVTAADSYLEEARTILKEAKSVKAERAGRDSQHPERQSSTQDDELGLDAHDEDRQHPADTKSVVEKLQFGDPDEAARELEEFIDRRTDQKAEQRQLQRLMDNDLVKSQAALKTFVAANPDLRAETPEAKMTARAIEQTLYDIYAEDIEKIGVVEADKIPRNDPQALANWHRFYRVHGHEVRDAASALEEARSRVMKWRGTPQTQQAPRKATDRISVNVDRTERRVAIPNQPTRTVSPRPDAAQATARTPASDVISRMRKARGQATA